jgi:hypothetical protein
LRLSFAVLVVERQWLELRKDDPFIAKVCLILIAIPTAQALLSGYENVRTGLWHLSFLRFTTE